MSITIPYSYLYGSYPWDHEFSTRDENDLPEQTAH